MATDTAQNPCTYKVQCKTCKLVELSDRPHLCKEMACPVYTPCAKCGNNVALSADKKCRNCTTKPQALPAEPQPEPELIAGPPPEFSSGKPTPLVRKFTVTVPGTPPPEYNDEEQTYYAQQWSQYEGYFRDPSAYPIAHNIILLEIELNHVIAQYIQSRMSDADGNTKAILDRHEKISNMMTRLRDQLPAKEATELSEDEKAIAAIYERYSAEAQKRRAGNVSRVLSPEAIALAPCLPFPVGLANILTRLGYKSISIEQALGKLADARDLPKDPILLLEALGMIVKEKVVDLASITGEHRDVSDLNDQPPEQDEKPPSPALFGFPQETDG